MKFPELEIQNFLALTNAKVNLSDRGLVLIQGDNQADTSADSNGVGKSSIPEALEWCWFGETARGVSGDDVINRDAKKDCFVKSVAIDGHITYTATRHRKHKTGKNTFTLKSFDGVKEVDLTKGTEKLTQEVAIGIIGCSLDVFTASIYAGQEKMPDLPSMTDKNLKVIIEEASGASLLEGAYRMARKDHDDALKALEVVRIEHDKADTQEGFLRAQVHSAKSQLGAWAGEKTVREQKVRDEISAVLPHLRRVKEDLEKFDKALIEAGIADCDSKIGLVQEEQRGLAALDKTLNDARAYEIAYANEKQMHEQAKLRAEKSLEQIEHQVGCPCSSCGRPLTAAELGTAKSKATEQFQAYDKALADAITKLAGQTDNVKLVQAARDEFAASMTDISTVAAQRSVFERQLATVNDLLRHQTSYANTARSWRDQLLAIQAETNPHHATVERLEKELAAAETKTAELKKKIAEEEVNVALEAEVVKIYSPAGVRAHILDDVTPFLNAQTAKYLTILSDGNIEAIWTTLTPDSKGVMKEKFTIEVTNATGGGLFKGLSGGEKRKVRVATALALQDLVATRATKPIDLFIGDEIDDALDSSGLERLMQILEEKARERGSVFVISHNELRDHIKQVLLVEKLPNKTTKITEMAA
jgi:DNA repair exonuclease SbcCD ATPase subunit